jgi:hypothetical protein
MLRSAFLLLAILVVLTQANAQTMTLAAISPPAGDSGSSAISPMMIGALFLLGLYQAFRRLRH